MLEQLEEQQEVYFDNLLNAIEEEDKSYWLNLLNQTLEQLIQLKYC